MFLLTPRVYAMVNLKPLAQGHVLVIPYRSPRGEDLARQFNSDSNNSHLDFSAFSEEECFSEQQPQYLRDCRPEEVKAVFEGAATVGKMLMQVYKCKSVEYGIQDGPLASQSIRQLHLHVIPSFRDESGAGKIRKAESGHLIVDEYEYEGEALQPKTTAERELDRQVGRKAGDMEAEARR
eukprot:CAMPEP_0170481316 /NCGR_PEP_ID=MMETSP0208-20121228/1806_1 /TAXON_ID=197538 /ORGANISM="Strombidium inclinatum, Strain S3" /LENGTH=179 /DNA_ID=CAMNT_0010753995 /DNA_START=26 /DNA_END=561 /DNA_ORIENTATION=-